MQYAAHIHIERTPWNDDEGADYSLSELVTSEYIEPRESVVVLLAAVFRALPAVESPLAGCKLNLAPIDGEPDQAEASWVDDGWLYDLRVAFSKVEPFNFAEWVASTP